MDVYNNEVPEVSYFSSVLDAKDFISLASKSLEDFINDTIDSVGTKIPVAGLVIGTVKLFADTYNRHLLKKTCAIIKAVAEDYDVDIINEYREKLMNNDKYARDEMERVALILNKTLEYEKTYLLGKLWMASILKILKPGDFLKYSLILDSIYYEDYVLLRKIYNNKDYKYVDLEIFEIGSYYRLQNSGLIIILTPSVLGENDHRHERCIPSKLAKPFIEALDSYKQRNAILSYNKLGI